MNVPPRRTAAPASPGAAAGTRVIGGVLAGIVTDEYGLPVEVIRDDSGVLRLDVGITSRMLTREQWALLVSYGDQALGITAEAENRRDIPASCTCTWEYDEIVHEHERTAPDPACPWHTGKDT